MRSNVSERWAADDRLGDGTYKSAAIATRQSLEAREPGAKKERRVSSIESLPIAVWKTQVRFPHALLPIT